MVNNTFLKFIYSEKAYVVPVKSKVEISQNFVAFSEYLNFNQKVFEPIVSAHSSDAM